MSLTFKKHWREIEFAGFTFLVVCEAGAEIIIRAEAHCDGLGWLSGRLVAQWADDDDRDAEVLIDEFMEQPPEAFAALFLGILAGASAFSEEAEAAKAEAAGDEPGGVEAAVEEASKAADAEG